MHTMFEIGKYFIPIAKLIFKDLFFTHNRINLKSLSKLDVISLNLLMMKLRLGEHDDFLKFVYMSERIIF